MLTKKEQRLRRARQTRIRSALPKKQKPPVWKKWRLIAPGLRITAASRRWPMQRAKLACSSKRIGNRHG